jgi:hypothetical protein
MKVTYVDPPSGWKYGFPKIDDFIAPVGADEETVKKASDAWFLSNGYPQHLIDEGMLKYCRYWEKEVKE